MRIPGGMDDSINILGYALKRGRFRKVCVNEIYSQIGFLLLSPSANAPYVFPLIL